MKPIIFEGMTHDLGAPPNWNVEKYGICNVLPCRIRDGLITSVWQLDWWERFRILIYGHITVHVHSQSMPPISLVV